MKAHRIHLDWSRNGGPFERGHYRRDHRIVFDGGQAVGASSSAEFGGNDDLADPEQQLASATSSCHMLTFLAVAANRGITVDTYEDEAEAVIGKNDEGQNVVTTITLRPRVTVSGENAPDADAIAKLHERAHKACFVSNSLKTTVVVAPRV